MHVIDCSATTRLYTDRRPLLPRRTQVVVIMVRLFTGSCFVPTVCAPVQHDGPQDRRKMNTRVSFLRAELMEGNAGSLS